MATIKQSQADHLSNTSNYIQSVYQRYKKSVLESAIDVSIHPTEKKYIGFRVNDRRMANFHMGRQSFKIWFNVKPGTLRDPKRLTRRTDKGHTIRIDDDMNFDYVVDLLRQAYGGQPIESFLSPD